MWHVQHAFEMNSPDVSIFIEQEDETADFSHSLEEIVRLVSEGGDEPKEEMVRDIDRKLKTWRTANPPTKARPEMFLDYHGSPFITQICCMQADADGTKPERRDGKRHKSATKQSTVHDAEMAALAGP